MLKTIYATAEEIPEGYADLYTERNGQWELTGISGVKTQADVDRVQGALTKERTEHKTTKTELAKFEGIDPELIHTQETELESLRAQVEAIGPNGVVDPEKLEPIIAARLKQATGPLERDKANLQRRIDTLQGTITEKEGEVVKLRTDITTGNVERTIRDAAIEGKVLNTALDDVVMLGSRVFEVTEDGRILSKDLPGTTPGLSPKEWLKDMGEKRPHWWATSQGGGSRGMQGAGPGANRINPWSKEHWNVTLQGAFTRANGEEKARAMAEAAGVKFGDTKPAAA